MNSGWLPEDDWQRIQDSVPVACVDVLIWRPHMASGGREVGLILRDTPHEGQRWCLVGGRLLLDECLVDAVRRQVWDTLATEPVEVAPQPLHVAEYARESRQGPHDPRKHAIGMTWAVQLSGTPAARGEGRDFRWFAQEDLPVLGFGQQDVVMSVLGALHTAGA
jgi:ADP-ribose pyrophosphatase YjhB (NUDIX family)